jgi:predicted dehydrogenase
MLRAAETHGARLFVNFQRRYGRPFEWVKEAVSQGKIGRLIGVQISQPGNEIINFGPHLIDAALNILDVPFACQPTHVLGAVEWSGRSYQGVPTESQIVGTIHFTDGVRMIVEAGERQPSRAPAIRFDGEDGFAELRLSALPGEPGIARGRFLGDSAVTVLESNENFHHGETDTNLYVDYALNDILRSVKASLPCRLDAATVLPGLEILLGLFASANSGKTMTFPLPLAESPFQRTQG